MKKYVWMICGLFMTVCLQAANPKWTAKVAKAVFTIKTFDTQGALLASSYGFFTDERGEAVSSFSIFKGAERALVIDAQGKEYAVDCLLGYDELYDVCKFQVDGKKFNALTVATAKQDAQNAAWLLPYQVKKSPDALYGTVSTAETFHTDYGYYTISIRQGEQWAGCPVLSDNGEVIGILQPAADSKSEVSYAVSAAYARSLKIKAMQMSDVTLQTIGIRKAVPDEQQDAVLSLFLAGSALNDEQYIDYVNRFIGKFPEASDGYLYRARIAIAKKDYEAANQDLQKVLDLGKDKADSYYSVAQCHLQMDDKKGALELLTKAVDLYEKPYQQEVAPYLYAREQVEVGMRRFQQALNDIREAVALDSRNALYRAELGSLCLRVNMLDEARQSAEECIRIAPRVSDGYLILGIVQCMKDEREAGLENLKRAEELGNGQATAFIEKYSH